MMFQNLCGLCSTKINGFIKVYDGTRYLILFEPEIYNAIFNRIRYFMEVKGRITYVFSHY